MSGTETWSLENYGSAKVVRGNDMSQYLIKVEEGASLTLEDITMDGNASGNETELWYSLIYVKKGTLTLQDGAVLQNNYVQHNYDANGGAIFAHSATVNMYEGSKIWNNKVAHDIGQGGGIYLERDSVFNMYGGEIVYNHAQRGGGIAVVASEVNMLNGSISYNRVSPTEKKPDEVQAYTGYYGGGVFVSNINNTELSDDSIGEAIFTMKGGTVSNNSASAVWDEIKGKNQSSGVSSYGGGIVAWDTVYQKNYTSRDVVIDLQGGMVSENSGPTGGVSVFFPGAKLKISGTAAISNNKSFGTPGGYSYVAGAGVAAYWGGSVEMSGGKIIDNETNSETSLNLCGGGVSLYGRNDGYSGLQTIFHMTGGCLENNTAASNGGGIYALGPNALVLIDGGSISGNTAEKNGGGIYLTSATGGGPYAKITGGSILENKANGKLKYKVSDTSWEEYEKSYSNGIFLSSESTMQIGGTAEINPDDDITISVASWTGSPYYSYVQVISPEWNNGGQDVSVTSYSGSSPKYTVENVSLTAAGTQLVSYNTEDGSVTEAYVEAAENAERTRLFVPSAAMLEANPNLAIGQSKILNTNSMNNFMTYIPAPISIKPANITIYMGGDGYAGTVVDNDGNTVSGDAVKENGFPEPGFVVTLPQSLEEQLEADGNDITDLTLQYKADNSGNTSAWKFEKYGEGEHNVYRIKPTETTNTTPVRMTFTPLNGGDPIDSDDFDFTTALYEKLQMKIYGEGVEEGKVTVAYGENEYAITTGTATLTVRGTSDASDDEQYGQVTTDAANIAKGDSGVVAEADTIYTINGSKVQVGQDDEVALLFDDILEDNNITGVTNTELLTEKADQVLEAMDVNNLTGTGERQYEAKYLDLVDRSNGNAWLAADKPITVYWPLPEGTDKNTKFELLHYPGMHREMGISTIKENIDSCQVERVTIKDITDTHIVFDVQPYQEDSNGNVTGGFSPYVLVWEDESGDGGDTPSTPVTPPDGDDTPDLNTEDHFSYIVGYPEDYRTGEPSDDEDLWPVKPQGNITRAEVATIFYRLLKDDVRAEHWTKSNDFTDVEADDWYNTPVSTLSAMGIITGYEDGSFKPNAPITRAEFAAMAVRFFEEDSAIYEKGTFNDIAGSEWFADAVQAAKDHSIIGGYPDGSFQPNKNISRAEACSIINRTLDRIPDADHLLPEDLMKNWPDNNPGDWYYADMQEATNGHEYEWITDDGKTVENWTGDREEIDWAKVEEELEAMHGGQTIK